MDSDEGVSLPLIHKHLMVPWNSLEKGDCCGGFETITDGYYCEKCEFFVHKKCSESSEYIQHPSHPGHTLQLQRKVNVSCDLCGKMIRNILSYRCEVCDFDMDLYCAKYPPPEVIDVSEKHRHKLTLLKEWTDFECRAQCRKKGEKEFHYKCEECDSAFHVDCVWHPPEVKHPLEVNHSLHLVPEIYHSLHFSSSSSSQYTTMDAGGKVLLPWIHRHFMMPWNDTKWGDCCKRYETVSDGYYCKKCDFFYHKRCCEETPESILHPSHSIHLLWLQFKSNGSCHLCGKPIMAMSYCCKICWFEIDLYCVKYPPLEVIDSSETHHHKLTLSKKRIEFNCDAYKCGNSGKFEHAYKCHECDLTFHVDCVWKQSELEVNHSYHSLHPLKLLRGQPPDYSDGKCRLCGRKIDVRAFYHCSSCNFTLDKRCALQPPPQSLVDSKAHDHQLTLLPRLDSFTCNACGLNGDGSRYVCFQCGFTIHQECLRLPRVININRHDHRVYRTSVLGAVNSICGVCRKKVDWIYGGYSCQRCPGFVVHSKCATKDNVWNGKELEGVPEEIEEDIEPYVVIDENTIQHFSHKEYNLRFHVNGLLFKENKWCNACNHPIGLQSFYGCTGCDFALHRNCAEFLKRKWHVLYSERFILITDITNFFVCNACDRISNGFAYQHGIWKIDVRCGSICEPFVHLSHPLHPLYHIPLDKNEICNGCNKKKQHVLRCIEDGCEFVLCFKCATLPQVVKHRVDDHPLSLCYGKEEASGKYWCDICEKEYDPRKWFYTCKYHRATLHTNCVFGDTTGLMPKSTIEYWYIRFEVVLNNSATRPVCRECKSRCIYPIILKMLGTSNKYFCSFNCVKRN